MNKNKAIAALSLFNEKTDKLINSKFVKHGQENGLKTSLKISVAKEPQISHNFPDKDAVDAFVLTIRFFIQDNELSSIYNLAELYSDLPLSGDIKNDFSLVRDKLNSEFDKESFISLKGQILTYRKIFDTFIYGGLAHANRNKKIEYDSWMKDKMIAPFITGEFYAFLWYFLHCIAYIKKINIRVLEEINNL